MTGDALSSKGALVLFSGGQDSAACLAWALTRYERVETVGFSYGQRHSVELEARNAVLCKIREAFPKWGERLEDDRVIELSALGQISDTALTRESEIVMTEAGLPSTFVPGRNLLFFVYAAALAYRRGLNSLVGGMCETDYSGYPDCRDATLRSLETSINLGMDRIFEIETPLMFRDKAATWALAYELGGQALCDIIIEHTHTCYLGVRDTRHAWGYGCGRCPACQLRENGYSVWQEDLKSRTPTAG